MLVAAHVLIAGVAVGFVDLQWATSMALAVAVLSMVMVRAPIAMALAWMGLYAAVIGWTQVGVGMRLVWALGFMLVAAYGGLCLHRRLRAERWGPTAVVTGLSLTLSVVAAHLTVTMISLRAHPSVIGERWMMVSLMGVFVGVTTLFASIMPWRALRRAAAARGGRIDEQGLIRFFDGREGRGEPGEPGEVIGWPSRRQRSSHVSRGCRTGALSSVSWRSKRVRRACATSSDGDSPVGFGDRVADRWTVDRCTFGRVFLALFIGVAAP